MKVNKVIFFIILLIVVPVVYADVTVICTPSNPIVGQAVSCNMQLSRSDASPTLSSTTFSISVSPSGIVTPSSTSLTNLPTGFTSTGTFANGYTIYTTDLARNPTSLGTLNFDAVASGGLVTVRLTFTGAEDDSFNNVLPQFTTVTPGMVTVGTACTPVTANCNRAGVACPSGNVIPQIVCSGATPKCNTGTGLCEAGRNCQESDWCGAWSDSVNSCGTRICSIPTGAACTLGITTMPISLLACPPPVCPSGQTACVVNGISVCRSLQTDTNNCGACGTACSTGQICSVGVCDSAGGGLSSCTPQEGVAVGSPATCLCDVISIGGNQVNRHVVNGQCTVLLGRIQRVFESVNNPFQQMVDIVRLLRCYTSSNRATCMVQ